MHFKCKIQCFQIQLGLFSHMLKRGPLLRILPEMQECHYMNLRQGLTQTVQFKCKTLNDITNTVALSNKGQLNKQTKT